MSPLAPATVAVLCASLVLMWVYASLYRVEPTRAMRLWTAAWAALPLRYAMVLLAVVFAPSALLTITEHLLNLLMGLLLLWGTYAYIGKNPARVWLALFALGAVWAVVGTLVQMPFLPANLPVFLLLGTTRIVTGVAMLRAPPPRTTSSRVVGWVFILFGLHQMDYPFLRPVEWFAPWGYAFAAMLEVVIAVGILLAYFQQLHLRLIENERRLAEDVAERQRAEKAEHEQRVLAEALRDTAAALNSALDRQEVLRRILEHIARLVPHDAATITMTDAGVMRVVGSRGYAERGLEPLLDSLAFRLDDSPKFNRMVETGQPVIVNDVKQDRDWIDIPETRWIAAYLGAPIRVDGETIGFINLDSEMAGVFREQHAQTLRAFADQAGIALRNARLYDALRRQAAELEQRVSSRTAELERERAQLRAILDAMNEGVIGMIFGSEPDSIAYRYTNSALQRLTGYAPDEWDPKTIFIGNLSPDTFAASWNEMIRSVHASGTWTTETRARRKDGSEFDARLTVTRITSRDGHAEGVVSIIRDISQEKALAEQKANFVTRASHELRTPIANLKTRLYLLRKRPDEIDSHLRILDDVSDRLKHLVEDLLDLSRFERGTIQLKRRRVNLQEFVAALVELQQPEAELKQIHLSCHLPNLPIVLEIDPDRIHQVLTNLITNAIHYTPSGGSIRIEAEAEDGMVQIQVKDTGVGILPEHLPHIFEPFYRAMPEGGGMGLGLSIAREIAQLHDGDLTVTSEPGRGSCFSLRLPPSI
ncbi:MAG: GAF domain-containing protein [Chloroflexi bacterium]|nr:GAF domain-containing protein [Chloroflexota bacterium]